MVSVREANAAPASPKPSAVAIGAAKERPRESRPHTTTGISLPEAGRRVGEPGTRHSDPQDAALIDDELAPGGT
jgi:hypothetical protein